LVDVFLFIRVAVLRWVVIVVERSA
jgi:hypothetical protein